MNNGQTFKFERVDNIVSVSKIHKHAIKTIQLALPVCFGHGMNSQQELLVQVYFAPYVLHNAQHYTVKDIMHDYAYIERYLRYKISLY